ncbi:MAG TPA: hypothetical protein VIJ30_02055 [Candidatus Dormibacteraeota bacterium]
MSVAIAVGTVCFLLTLIFLAVTARRAIIASAKSWTELSLARLEEALPG